MMLLHTWDVVGNDILPMIHAYHSGAAELILDAVKLLVFLTLPADPRSMNLNEQRHYINRTVQSLTKNSCAVIFSHMAEPLERFESGRLHLRDEDGRTIQLLLTFVRNLLLSYRENFPGNAPSSSQRVQPKGSILNILFDLHLPDLLCQMAKDARKKPFAEDITLLIEIFHLLFQSQVPSSLIHFLDHAGEKPKFDEYRQYGEQAASTLMKNRTARSRHGRFGGKTIYANSFQRSGKDQTTQLRKYYGARIFENSHESSLPSGLNERSQLAELARTLLVDGGFNEVVYVAWDHIRQRDMMVCNDEDQLNVHSFFALSQFFVTFVSLSFDWNLTDISKSDALSNLFDKHLFFWLRKKWEMFDHSKDVRGLLHVSALVKEMLALMEKIASGGSQADKFVCQALTAEGLCAEGDDGYHHFCNSLVKKFDSKSLPMIYLADCIEVLHIANNLIRELDPKLVALDGEMLNERSVSNYISLLAFFECNSSRLKSILIRKIKDITSSEYEGYLHAFGNLQIIHDIVVDGENKYSTETVVDRDDFLKLKDMAASILIGFMQTLYSTKSASATNYKKRKHTDLVLL
mmetsp:Transcript_13207/g.57576  ORF Transcript_13207/g.57576 Transcript_13207/m.57576 type:complete len:577 (+) Transcript_13207:420-2150(+)